MEEQSFFSYENFMPHGHCFLWKPEILWLHVVSDVLIFLAYMAIPLTLLFFFRLKNMSSYRWVLLMFSLFICFCGFTHLISIVTIWYPLYALEGVVKAITAAISIATAILFIPIAPRAFRMISGFEAERQERISKTENH